MPKRLADIKEAARRLREAAYVATVPAKKRTYRSDTFVDDDESRSLEPKAAGERAFKKMHTSTITDFGDQDKNINQADTKKRINHRAGDELKIGERTPIRQDMSKVAADNLGSYTKQTPPNYADKRGGDTSVVRISPSAVEPYSIKSPRVSIKAVESNPAPSSAEKSGEKDVVRTSKTSIKQFRESMQFGIRRIIESKIGGRVIFEDGHVDVDNDLAAKLAEVYSLLEGENAAKFIEIGSMSAKGLRDIIDFVLNPDVEETD